MKLRNLASVLRNEPLPALIGEAGMARYPVHSQIDFPGSQGQSSDCPVIFRPIGYYRVQRDLVSERSRAAILAYADAILRGEYPLMGYGAPHLGMNPDWQCDWVSGKSWPIEASGKMHIVRHDGSDVKAPWELSRLQFGPGGGQGLRADRR